MADEHLTERQRKWFASVREGLERDTGRDLAQWVEIARTCPETGHRARLRWLKENYGLLQNRASLVLDEAFESTMPWSDPAALVTALWTAPVARGVYEALDRRAMALADTIRSPRKGYTAWSRKVQFAAARPVRAGVMLGLAVPLDLDPRLEPRANQSWSERLTSRLSLADPSEVDNGIGRLLEAAWSGA
jgi:hypothetical protein